MIIWETLESVQKYAINGFLNKRLRQSNPSNLKPFKFTRTACKNWIEIKSGKQCSVGDKVALIHMSKANNGLVKIFGIVKKAYLNDIKVIVAH